MATNYQSIAFGEETKKLQEKYGSRSAYARMEQKSFFDGLTESEQGFIAERDGFYMATIGHEGFPYMQYRGGPAGFLKSIDTHTLAFLDFTGNKQYISTGNMTTNNKAALFIMDYARKARLKIYALAEIVPLGSDLALEKLLDLPGYPTKAERIIKLSVQAYDWNCPQHIVQRFTIAEIEDAFAQQRDYISLLKAEIAALKSAASHTKP